MFDAFTGGRAGSAAATARFVEDGDADAGSSLFGAVSSYALCGGCGRYHGMQDAGDGGGQGVLLNVEDRGGYGPNGKPSLDPIQAGAQITRFDVRWGAGGMGTAATVTYAFRSTAPGTMPEATTGFSRFTDLQIAATLLALQSWSDVANITFTRVNDTGSNYSNNATMLFGNYSDGAEGAAAFAYLPGSITGGGAGFNNTQGDVWVNSSLSYNATPVMQGYGQLVLVHEIGHAIGLSHPAAYNAGEGEDINYEDHATYFEDSIQFTVMSYFDETSTGANYYDNGVNYRFPASVLLDDIAAAQRLYGANMTTRTGDTVYGFNSTADRAWYNANNASSALIFAVWDAGGTDTLDFSGYSVTQLIDLRQGHFSSVGGLIGNVAIAIGAVIENAIGGSGVDVIHGNSANNRITGGLGNDVIDAGLGTDTVVFSGLRSAYTITWNGQTATVVGPDGTDTVINAEFLAFDDQTIATTPTGGLMVAGDYTAETISGTAFADTIAAAGGNDTVNGLAGNDTLGGGAGNDILNGGDDNDTLNGGLGNDTLNGGNGYDVADYTGAGAGVTVSLLTGSSSGGAGNDTLISIEAITGTAHNDTLIGDAGNNVIRGNGGIDTIGGGAGNDTLYAGAPGLTGGAADIIKASGTVNNSQGTAVVISSTTAYDLLPTQGIADSSTIPHATVQATATGSGTEWYAVTLTAGQTVSFDIDGAAFDSCLILYNSAGVEVDRNDDSATDPGSTYEAGFSYVVPATGTYYIQVAQWQSNVSGGFTFQNLPAGATYTLHVSNPGATPVALTATGSTLNGDAGNDTLYGGSGVDTLSGGADNDIIDGGAGNDLMGGGTGNDTFYADSAADLVFEGLNEGTDTVIASASYYLYANVENLTLAAGAGDIFGVGNELANLITGNTGANLLIAGAGNDTVNGGAGNDNIYGQDGDDILNGEAGIDYLVGGIGNDVIDGGTEADALYGEDGNDTLIGGAGFVTDILVGGAGADILRGDSTLGDYDLMDGGSGDDIYYVDTGDDLTFEAAGGGTDTVYADVRVANGGVYLYANVENLVLIGTTAFGVGNELNNVLTGNASANYLLGGAGNDRLNGMGGNDVLFGEAGQDVFAFSVGSGGDVIGDFSMTDDRMDVSAFFSSFAQVQANFSQVGADGAINLGNGDFIVLHNVTMANLTASHFIFAGASPQIDTEVKDAGAQVLPGLADDGFLLDGKDGGAQILPGIVETLGGKDAGAQVLPGIVETFGGKGSGAQILPGAPDAGLLGGKDAGAQIFPGLMDDGFLLSGKGGADLGPQILPGPADDGADFLFDLGGDTVSAGDDMPVVNHRLAMLFVEAGEHAPDSGPIDAPLDLHHNPDPWAA